jgi:hypothetical protein
MILGECEGYEFEIVIGPMGKKTIITEVEEGCLVLFCIYLSKLEFS